MTGTVRENIRDINLALADYQRLSGKSTKEVLEKQGGKLAHAVYEDVWGTRPVKGDIRAKILQRLAQRRGINIRPSAKDFVERKRAGLTATGKARTFSLSAHQMEIKREINIRESGRGVLGISVRYPMSLRAQYAITANSRYGTILSDASVHLKSEGGVAQIAWRGISQMGQRALKGIEGSTAQGAIKDAIVAVKDDILVYNKRKQKELITKAVKGFVKEQGK